jgi:hypothetical protein
MKLAYLNIGLSSVFDSQVLNYLNFINGNSMFDKIILLCGYRNREERLAITGKVNGTGFKTYMFRYFPNYPVLNILNSTSIFFSLIRARISRSNDTIFHVRGELATFYICHALKILDIPINRVIADIRGAGMEEIEDFRGGNKVLKTWKIKNYRTALKNLRIISHVSTVSESLRHHLIEQFNLKESNVSVVPCLSGSDFHFNINERKVLRDRLSINDDELLFVFSSNGEALWQNSSIIETVKLDGFKILNLSSKRLNHKNIINCFIPYSDVPKYLSAADAGIIFRSDSIVNKVASPVKFSEYVCMGLPILSNGNVDVIKEYIETTGNGVILNSADSLSSLEFTKFKFQSREEIIKEGKTRFSIERVSMLYTSIYRRISFN